MFGFYRVVGMSNTKMTHNLQIILQSKHGDFKYYFLHSFQTTWVWQFTPSYGIKLEYWKPLMVKLSLKIPYISYKMWMGLCILSSTAILSTLIYKNQWNKRKEKKQKINYMRCVCIYVYVQKKKKELQVNAKVFKSLEINEGCLYISILI